MFGEEIVGGHPAGLIACVKLPEIVIVLLATVELDSHALVSGEIEERQEVPVAGNAVQLALFVGVPLGTLSSDALTFEIVDRRKGRCSGTGLASSCIPSLPHWQQLWRVCLVHRPTAFVVAKGRLLPQQAESAGRAPHRRKRSRAFCRWCSAPARERRLSR